MGKFLLAVGVSGVAILAVKLVYDKWIGPLVPDKVLWEAVDLDTDDIAFSLLAAAAVPTIVTLIHRAGVKAA